RIADKPSDRAQCPACGEDLSLATCDCGKALTSEHREVSMSHEIWGIARGVVGFKCPSCGKPQAVELESRRNRGLVALCAAILMGALGAGLTWWAGSPAIIILLVGALCAVEGPPRSTSEFCALRSAKCRMTTKTPNPNCFVAGNRW